MASCLISRITSDMPAIVVDVAAAQRDERGNRDKVWAQRSKEGVQLLYPEKTDNIARVDDG